jgi:flagellar motor switch protein FliN/FliY
VNATLSKPYDWLKEFPLSVFQLDEKPLFGNSPPFPWPELSKALTKTFDFKEIKFEPALMQWREATDLLSGIGAKPVSYSILFSELEGALYWIMPMDQIEKLMTFLLSAPAPLFDSIEKGFVEGFYCFILSQFLKCVNETKFVPNLGAGLDEKAPPPLNPAFCIDVLFSIQDMNFKGRMVITQELKASWKEKFAERKLDFIVNNSLASKIFVPIHLEIGKTQLSPLELEQLAIGDYLLLDSCSYEPDSDKGRLMMTLDGRPLFRAKLKQGSIKILEFPLYPEDLSMKGESEKEEDENEEDEENESYLEDLESETESEDTEQEDLTEDETLSEEPEEETEEEPEEETEEETEAEETEEEDYEDTLKEDKTQKGAPSKKEITEKTTSPLPEKGAKTTKAKIADLPLNVVIEMGRIQLSVQKLMELQPGNMLEVDLHPENGVDLVVNGKRIGKGELLRVGETIGVRILDI